MVISKVSKATFRLLKGRGAAINTTGKTQLRIYFVVDDNDNGVTDYIGFYSSDNSDPESHPQLVIKYEP